MTPMSAGAARSTVHRLIENQKQYSHSNRWTHTVSIVIILIIFVVLIIVIILVRSTLIVRASTVALCCHSEQRQVGGMKMLTDVP